jgi:hypothetical protein
LYQVGVLRHALQQMLDHYPDPWRQMLPMGVMQIKGTYRLLPAKQCALQTTAA